MSKFVTLKSKCVFNISRAFCRYSNYVTNLNMNVKLAFQAPKEPRLLHNCLLTFALYFGYKLCPWQANTWLAVLSNCWIFASILIIHLQSLDHAFVAIFFDEGNEQFSYQCLEEIKYVLVKVSMALLLDLWLYRRQQIIDCIDRVIVIYRAMSADVNSSSVRKCHETINKAIRYCCFVIAVIPLAHCCLAAVWVAKQSDKDIEIAIKRIVQGCFISPNITKSFSKIAIQTILQFDSYVFTILVEGSRLAGAVIMCFVYYVFAKSLDAFRLKIDIGQIDSSFQCYRLIQKTFSVIEDTFGLILLINFAMLFFVANCDIFVAAINVGNRNYSYLRMARVGLFWLPHLGMYFFSLF